MPSATDRIEKEIRLAFPPSRVWRAITNAQEFGKWFGVALVGDFVPGEPIRGQITARGYEHVTFEAIVAEIEPEHRFSFQWHPYAIEQGVDYSHEPRTLVTFTLESDGEGTLLKVVESGFDGIPAERRAKAFEMDSKGWTSQVKNVEKYLASSAS